MDVAREVHEVFVFIVKTNVPDLVQLPSDGEPDGGEPKAGELGCPVVEHMFAEVRVGDIRHGTMNSGELGVGNLSPFEKVLIYPLVDHFLLFRVTFVPSVENRYTSNLSVLNSLLSLSAKLNACPGFSGNAVRRYFGLG